VLSLGRRQIKHAETVRICVKENSVSSHTGILTGFVVIRIDLVQSLRILQMIGRSGRIIWWVSNPVLGVGRSGDLLPGSAGEFLSQISGIKNISAPLGGPCATAGRTLVGLYRHRCHQTLSSTSLVATQREVIGILLSSCDAISFTVFPNTKEKYTIKPTTSAVADTAQKLSRIIDSFKSLAPGRRLVSGNSCWESRKG
jgi:hypothetical protein